MESSNQRGDRNLNVQGDVEESIVIVGDGNVVGQSIYYVNVFTSISIEPPSSQPPQKFSEQEIRSRQTLIHNVRTYWVEGVLRKSLYSQITVELGIEERSSAIAFPVSNVGTSIETNNRILPEDTQAAEIFDGLGTGRTLLILGRPGSGKTITLLKITESLLGKADSNLNQLIPIVLNLSSWSIARQPIEQWLVQELNTLFNVPEVIGKKWIDKEQLILCLDGLDEVTTKYRSSCVQAINRFLKTHNRTEVGGGSKSTGFR